MTSRARIAIVTVLALAAAVVTVPGPAAAAGRRCFISDSGSGVSDCAGMVTFTRFAPSTTFAPFQGVPGIAPQPDISVSFSRPVHALRIIANDPDFAGTRVMVHQVGAWSLTPLNTTVDNQPDVFTVSTQSIDGASFDYLVLESDDNDYVNWFVEYQWNLQGWCRVNQPWQSCSGVSTSVTPHAPAGMFNPFQSELGIGPQTPIDIRFDIPQVAVAVTAVDPDYPGSQMEAYDANGLPLAAIAFDFDLSPMNSTVSTKSISDNRGIARIRLVPAPNDYVAFQGLTVTAR